MTAGPRSPGPYAAPAERSPLTSAGGHPHRRRSPNPPFIPAGGSSPGRAEIGYEEWAGGQALHADSKGLERPRARAPIAPPDADLRAHAADSLEVVALRIRVGELRPLGLSADLSEPAVVAAVLAAMLASRR